MGDSTGQSIAIDSDGNASGVTNRSGGVTAGIDGTWETTQLGVAISYASGKTNTDSRFSEIEADTVRIVAYGGTRLGNLNLKGGASFGWSSFDSDRRVNIGAISETARGDYDGRTASVFGDASYTFAMQGVRVEPFAGLMMTNIDNDGFTETGAPVTGLTVGGIDETLTFSTIGFRFAGEMRSEGAKIVPKANIGWRHAFDGDPIKAALQLPTGADFISEGLPIAEDSLTLGAGLESHFASGVVFGLAYQGDFADNARNHGAHAGVRVPF